MRAMVLDKQGEKLTLKQVPMPVLSGPFDVLIQVSVCGVCRTDLHVVDGDLKFPRLPLIPGHQIIGYVKACAPSSRFNIGDRIGVPWLGGSCGHCEYCLKNQENLCDNAKYTGYQINGGFAEYCVADSRFCFTVPKDYPDLQAAPLFCAGLIGFRAINKIRNARTIGFYGFGASAHILTQLAVSQGKEVYAFTRPGDIKTQRFATSLNVTWTGGSDEMPPKMLDGAIIFAPEGNLVPIALKHVKKGGTVVCAGIHMSDIPSFAYEILWGERHICSVANLTRFDGEAFLNLAPLIPIHTNVQVYPLDKVNEALEDLRQGRFEGAAVIQI